MADLLFEWDSRKASENHRKHGVTFEEAETVFSDEWALVIDDPQHSEDEARFVILGMGVALCTLVVCHCYRKDGDVIRIISARKANKDEREVYDRRWKA